MCFTYVLTLRAGLRSRKKEKKKDAMNVFIGRHAVNQRAQLMATPKRTLMARGTVTLLEAPV